MHLLNETEYACIKKNQKLCLNLTQQQQQTELPFLHGLVILNT
jgi:hypothetical protein